MTQMLAAKLINHSPSNQTETYEVLWSIRNWRSVRAKLDQINSQKAIFETGTTSWFKTKWLVGIKEKPTVSIYDARVARVYWQLLDIRGTSSIKMEAKVQTQLLNTDRKAKYTDEKTQHVSFGDIIEENKGFLRILSDANANSDLDYVQSDGSIQYKLVLTLKTPGMTTAEYEQHKMEEFLVSSNLQRHLNFAEIFNSSTATDFKIVTSDGVELLAHKIILRAQCPVFAGMLDSDLSEASNGVVKLDDISAETMKTILHYFYTGELLIEMNASNVVEFTYAAGKYQMRQVLELLDNLLGRNDKEASNQDVQLLSLTGKLSLKNAESRFLNRIVTKIQRVKRSEQLFELFGFEEKDILETAEILANEKLGDSYVLEIMNYLLVGTGRVSFLERGLPFLALLKKRSLKTFEDKLIELFARISKRFKNSEELFAVFGHGKQMF